VSTTTPTPAMDYQPLVAWWWSADTAPPMVAADFLRTLHKNHGGMQPTAKRGGPTHALAMVLDCGVWEHVPDGRRYTGAVVGGRWTPEVPPCDRFAAMMLVELTPETVAAGTFIERRQFNMADVRKVESLELDPATGTLVATTPGGHA
jgi:hypothetical protein